MNTRNFLLVVLMGLSLIGCNTTEKYAANNAAGQRWLDEHRGGAGISVGGIWQSEDWGGSKLVQEGRAVNGTLGSYSVRGVVSGQRAYLLLQSGGWIHYRRAGQAFGHAAFRFLFLYRALQPGRPAGAGDAADLPVGPYFA